MPRYFFDLVEAAGRDDEGTELASLEEVRAELLDTLVSIAREKPAVGAITIEVRDESGALVLRASLAIRLETF